MASTIFHGLQASRRQVPKEVDDLFLLIGEPNDRKHLPAPTDGLHLRR